MLVVFKLINPILCLRHAKTAIYTEEGKKTKQVKGTHHPNNNQQLQ